jgi:Restriction endonuclease
MLVADNPDKCGATRTRARVLGKCLRVVLLLGDGSGDRSSLRAMTTSNEKGELLEGGVRVIEQAILGRVPGIGDHRLRIDSRKIVVHNGVRHEIDLYVQLSSAPGYDATFIFECKNWKDKVNKNEIIVFSEKIKACGAQRGFFVATAFTADAEAQAKLDERMVLLTANAETFASALSLADQFHLIEVTYDVTDVGYKESLVDAENTPLPNRPLDESAKAVLDGIEYTIIDIAKQWQASVQDRRLSRWDSATLPEGSYPVSASETLEFQPRQLIVDGHEYRRVDITLAMTVRVIRPGVVATVRVGDRGTAIKLEPVRIGGGEMQIWFSHTKR